MNTKYVLLIFSLIGIILFSGCSQMNYDKLAKEELMKSRYKNVKQIMASKTNLEIPLRTFGRDFAYVQSKALMIGIYPIKNETANKQVPVKVKRIITTASSKLASSPVAASKLKFVDAEPVENVYFPYFVIGVESSITEYENVVETYNDMSLDTRVGGGSTTVDIGANMDRTKSYKILTLDLNAVNKRNNGIFPFGYTSNSLVLTSKGKGGSFSLYILGNGFTFGKDIYVADSFSLNLRFLTEFSMIQLLGRLDNLPYWHCLRTKKQDKLMVQYMREEWDTLSEKRKVLRYSKIAKLYFGYYIAPNLANRDKITFNYKDKEGDYNTRKLIKILMDFYHIKADMYDFNTYVFLFNNAPFCSFPRDRKLENYLKARVNNATFQLKEAKAEKNDKSEKFKDLGNAILRWE